jgi:adenylate cyclase
VGKVITGNIGIGVNNNLTAMGMPVNIASRIQDATKELNNSFVISDSVYKLLTQPPEAEEIEISLKGIKNSINVFICGRTYSK